MMKPSPVLIFDGDCNFCRFWITRCRSITGEGVRYEPSQAVGAEYPQVPVEAFDEAVQWVDGEYVCSGADAVVEVLRRGNWFWQWVAWLLALPWVLGAARAGYRWVARHRMMLSRLTRWAWGAREEDALPPTFDMARWGFLKALGLVCVVAFASFGWQARGLIGEGGIAPVTPYLAALAERDGGGAFWKTPTLFWLGSSDAGLLGVCVLGVVCGVLVIWGRWQGPALFLAWALYLSLVKVGGVFLSFQWDVLLLEVLLLAVFLSPSFRWKGPVANASWTVWIARWLLVLLLFRLMIESGMIKLVSELQLPEGERTWWSLTALRYHFETQPLPLPLAWWAHRLPEWMLKGACAGMFVVELLVPFFIFLSRRFRQVAFVALVGLQGLIVVTGNYTFFNFLTVALCLLFIDDACWPRRWRRWVGLALPKRRSRSQPDRPLLPPVERSRWGWRWPVVLPLAGVSLLIGHKGLVEVCRPATQWPAWVNTVATSVAPWHSVNRYGLFAWMTKTRPEIIVEGSADGVEWKPYDFHWKPGPLGRRPGWVAPHQPRLDWQMWFAALGDLRHNPWFANFLVRLLEGSPQVSALLREDPFAGGDPPRYVRARLFRYNFSPRGPDWWVREEMGLYCPPVSLRKE